jgi:hypothetical protein
MGCDNEEMLQGNVERFSSSSNKTEPELFSEIGLFLCHAERSPDHIAGWAPHVTTGTGQGINP